VTKKNKFYWLEGVTEKGTRALLTDENSKFRWLRSQRNRRILVVTNLLGIVLVGLASYSANLKTDLNISTEAEITVFSVWAIVVIVLTLGAYSFIRIAVRGIADAPDELLDERQIQIRNTSYRYAYFGMCYVVLAVLLMMFFGPDLQLFQNGGNDGSFLVIATLFAFAAAPSLILAWRERDI
jgi:hypothetical protein